MANTAPPVRPEKMTWPPVDCHRPNKLYNEWGAWYSGDVERLMEVYGGTGQFIGTDRLGSRPSQFSGGVVGALARFWWGRPTTPQQPSVKLHLPAAGDLSMYAADLLFGEPPDITVGEPDLVVAAEGSEAAPQPSATNARFDLIAEQGGMFSRLLEAAEVASAYGGVYLRATVPAEVDGFRPVEVPVLEAIPPDAAVPEWRNGLLVGVTFWRELARATSSNPLSASSTTVWRHLETHRPGVVFHQLYKGTEDRLGEEYDLAARPETELFQPVAPTGINGLDVAYVPNMRPNRLIRGTPLGRSDYSGAEPIMDALDETWSSWMRDIRLGKGRMVVPSSALESAGRGQGSLFDIDREVFAGINTLGQSGAADITVAQFAIRVAEHRDTAAAQLRQIWRTAGYSVGENGEESESQSAATATEVVARGARTAATRKRKIGYWMPALQHMCRVLAELDVATFKPDGVRIDPSTPVDIEFPAAVAPDPKAVAETINLLSQAEAVSTQTKVEMAHPAWSPTEVAAEVARIQEGAAPVAEPTDLFGA